MLILFVSLKINSCAEIDKSSEFANPSLSEQILFSEKNNICSEREGFANSDDMS